MSRHCIFDASRLTRPLRLIATSPRPDLLDFADAERLDDYTPAADLFSVRYPDGSQDDTSHNLDVIADALAPVKARNVPMSRREERSA